jgi:hypothetical protein
MNRSLLNLNQFFEFLKPQKIGGVNLPRILYGDDKETEMICSSGHRRMRLSAGQHIGVIA